jgi:beta-lactamase class A
MNGRRLAFNPAGDYFRSDASDSKSDDRRTMPQDPQYCRRAFLNGATGLCLWAASPPGMAATRPHKPTPFAAIEAKIGGRVGVAAVDTRTGARLSHRGDERFAMCSSFKWVLVAAILARIDRGEITLDQRVSYSAANLLPHSPISEAHVGQGGLSIEELCAAAVEFSDNTAANALLVLVDGPAGLTQYLRRSGDPTTRLDRIEMALNSNLPGDRRDTTTPNAMVATMARLLTRDALSVASRARLIGWMKDCRTGLTRLRAGLPPAWSIGDKTGTGVNGASIDNAIAWRPDGPPILIASYLTGSHRPDGVLDAAHATIGRIVAAAFG